LPIGKKRGRETGREGLDDNRAKRKINQKGGRGRDVYRTQIETYREGKKKKKRSPGKNFGRKKDFPKEGGRKIVLEELPNKSQILE